MTNTHDYAGFVLRIGLGAMFIAHGLLKVLVFTLPGTVGFFESVGFPGWTAYVVVFAEIGGGVLLLAGFAVRAVSLALVPILLGATFVHLGNGWVFSNTNGGWEYPAFLTLAVVVQVLLGPGKFAASFALFRKSPVYETAVQAALEDGQISKRQRRVLDSMIQSMSIDSALAERMENDARSVLAN